MFLYQKTIDRSALRQGFQILVELYNLFKAMPRGMPSTWEMRNIVSFHWHARCGSSGTDILEYSQYCMITTIFFILSGKNLYIRLHQRGIMSASRLVTALLLPRFRLQVSVQIHLVNRVRNLSHVGFNKVDSFAFLLFVESFPNGEGFITIGADLWIYSFDSIE